MLDVRTHELVLLVAFTWTVLLGMGGCHRRAEKSGLESEVPTDSGPSFITLYKSPSSYFIGTVRVVIRDSTRWRAAWDSAYRYKYTATQFPEVDFHRYMLLLAADPGRGGDSIVIDQVTASPETLHVHVTSFEHCHPPDVSTHPVHVVRVLRSERAPVFENEIVRGFNCIPPEPE